MLNLTEGVLRLHKAPVEVTFGKKIYSWGTADAINPIDYLNPYDLLDSQCLWDFPEVKFVLLHVYPFETSHAVLLRHTPNLYADLSWLALSSGDLLERALVHLVGFAADCKVVIGCDATSFEEAYGAMAMTRQAVENALVKKVESGYLSLADAVEIPYRILRNNAISLWNLPLEIQEPA